LQADPVAEGFEFDVLDTQNGAQARRGRIGIRPPRSAST